MKKALRIAIVWLGLCTCFGVFLNCPAQRDCVAGATQLCNCTATQKGVQTCIASGTAWSTCKCDGTPDSGPADAAKVDNAGNTDKASPGKTFCDLDSAAVAGTYTMDITDTNGNQIDFLTIIIPKDGTITVQDKRSPKALSCVPKSSRLCDLDMDCTSQSGTGFHITFKREGGLPTGKGEGLCGLDAKGLKGTFKWVMSNPKEPKQRYELLLEVGADGHTFATMNQYDAQGMPTGTVTRMKCNAEAQDLCKYKMTCKAIGQDFGHLITFTKQ